MPIKPYYGPHAGITIYHGDCRFILPSLPKFDLCLTDPPYGIGADVKQGKRAGKQHGNALAPSRNYGVTDWDSAPPDEATIGLLLAAARKCIIWGGNYFTLPPSRAW